MASPAASGSNLFPSGSTLSFVASSGERSLRRPGWDEYFRHNMGKGGEDPNPFSIYRATSTLGVSLRETLEELQQAGKLTQEMSSKIQSVFDIKMDKMIQENKRGLNLSLKNGKVVKYSRYKDIAHFHLKDVSIQVGSRKARALPSLHILAVCSEEFSKDKQKQLLSMTSTGKQLTQQPPDSLPSEPEVLPPGFPPKKKGKQ